MLDDLSQAVLSREEVVRYLKGTHGESPEAAQERVYAYLEELRTTQRYRLYRALQHPVYPILRKIPGILTPTSGNRGRCFTLTLNEAATASASLPDSDAYRAGNSSIVRNLLPLSEKGFALPP